MRVQGEVVDAAEMVREVFRLNIVRTYGWQRLFPTVTSSQRKPVYLLKEGAQLFLEVDDERDDLWEVSHFLPVELVKRKKQENEETCLLGAQ